MNRASWSGVTVDCLDPVRVGTFWSRLLDREPSETMPGWVRLGTRGQSQPVLNFQPVSEPKHNKVRIHIDVTVDDIDEGIQHVVTLGGRWLDQRRDYPGEGVVVLMADPENNEFCLVQYFTDEPSAAPASQAAGRRTESSVSDTKADPGDDLADHEHDDDAERSKQPAPVGCAGPGG